MPYGPLPWHAHRSLSHRRLSQKKQHLPSTQISESKELQRCGLGLQLCACASKGGYIASSKLANKIYPIPPVLTSHAASLRFGHFSGFDRDHTTTTRKDTWAKGMVNLLTLVVLSSGITFELKLGHNLFFHHHHSTHLKNESKLPLSYNDT